MHTLAKRRPLLWDFTFPIRPYDTVVCTKQVGIRPTEEVRHPFGLREVPRKPTEAVEPGTMHGSVVSEVCEVVDECQKITDVGKLGDVGY